MLNAEPDYPHIVLGFIYRGCRIQIDQGECEGQLTYAAWVDHQYGSAVAVPFAFGRAEAIRKAKQWIDARLG